MPETIVSSPATSDARLIQVHGLARPPRPGAKPLEIKRDCDLGGRRGEPRPRENRGLANIPTTAVQHGARARKAARNRHSRAPWPQAPGRAIVGRVNLAVIADMHGNLAALEAVLADVARRGVTRIVN